MVTGGGSVTSRTTGDSPKGAARAAESRGYEVPVEGRSRGALMEQRRRRRGWRLRLHTTLELIRANPTGRVALKIFIGILGALVVTIGIALIPLPGPGWLLVIAGLGVWAVEFHWARRLLAFTRRHVNSWTQWVKRQSLGVRFVLGAVGLVFVSVVVWLSLKYSLGIDVVAQALHYLATH
ncbi:TIGR02611 family protein [Micromonospora chalcea]|uniref:TIGR02611 family protein n=1 Tax=Micromonospora sp. TSRI0369 TaxID=1703936 RepID=UPI0018EA2744|nr:TIGR02611 family protein [Micromonospora sp. TSRI0369]